MIRYAGKQQNGDTREGLEIDQAAGRGQGIYVVVGRRYEDQQYDFAALWDQGAKLSGTQGLRTKKKRTALVGTQMICGQFPKSVVWENRIAH